MSDPGRDPVDAAPTDDDLSPPRAPDDPEAATLDARGLKCPLPVLKARKRLQSAPAGGGLWVLADDPAAVVDIPHFCQEQGHEFRRRVDLDANAAWYLIVKAAPPI